MAVEESFVTSTSGRLFRRADYVHLRGIGGVVSPASSSPFNATVGPISLWGILGVADAVRSFVDSQGKTAILRRRGGVCSYNSSTPL